ncbi:MAG: hypothetical protein ACD_46C00719G0001 [uncultured bacterium]|nr:MAG: hypothetical protein ACD_46C00719G0001 [uncultured bacterium]
MTRARAPQDNSMWLINAMQNLGYRSNPGGVCHGLTCTWIESALLNELDIFTSRLKYIRRRPHLHTKIKRIEKRLAEKKRISTHDKHTLTIKTFFDNIELSQQPELYPHLFDTTNQPIYQDIFLTSPLTMTDKLAAKGGINKTADFSGIYSIDDLKKYLTSFRQAVINTNTTCPIAFSLSCMGHIIGLHYELASDTWHLMNASNLFPKKIRGITAAARMLAKSLYINKNDEHVCMSTHVFSTKADQRSATACINTWMTSPIFQELHAISSEKANLIDSPYGASWLHMAVDDNQVDIAEKLLQTGADVNLPRKDSQATPLHLAAESGRIKPIKLLIEYGANINSSTPTNHATPLFIAALNGHANVIQYLLACGANANIASIESLSSFRELAKDFSFEKAAEEFISKKSTDNLIMIYPHEIAALRGHQHCADLITQYSTVSNPNRFFNKRKFEAIAIGSTFEKSAKKSKPMTNH